MKKRSLILPFLLISCHARIFSTPKNPRISPTQLKRVTSEPTINPVNQALEHLSPHNFCVKKIALQAAPKTRKSGTKLTSRICSSAQLYSSLAIGLAAILIFLRIGAYQIV